MDKLIKAFDELMADSIKKGISIFKNPLIEHFIILCKEELSHPEAYDALAEHLKQNEEIYLSHMSDDPSESLTVNLATLKLRHFILKKAGIDSFRKVVFV